MDFQLGDVLFILENDGSLSDMIANVEKGYDDEKFNHAGMYAGDDKVIEATKDGVVLTDLNDFIFRAVDDVLVARVSISMGKKAATYANKQVGKAYNDTFVPTEDKFYCTELIVKAYDWAAQEKFFTEHKLTFPTSGEQFEFWKSYYEKRNMQIPFDALGTNPASLSKDKKFQNHYYVMFK